MEDNNRRSEGDREIAWERERERDLIGSSAVVIAAIAAAAFAAAAAASAAAAVAAAAIAAAVVAVVAAATAAADVVTTHGLAIENPLVELLVFLRGQI